jgi:hypothetical protein
VKSKRRYTLNHFTTLFISCEIYRVAYRIIKEILFWVTITLTYRGGIFNGLCYAQTVLNRRQAIVWEKSYNLKWPPSCTVRFMFPLKPPNLWVYDCWEWCSVPSGNISYLLNDNICNTFKPKKNTIVWSLYTVRDHITEVQKFTADVSKAVKVKQSRTKCTYVLLSLYTT